ncbi:MAG: hypothetical protein MSC52_09215 [Solobacterium sp.]|nr:hypothetical protein [Solobacterium sp.]
MTKEGSPLTCVEQEALKEMEEVIDEIIEKHNTTVNMVNTLNNRIKDVAEEQNERKRS